MVVKIIKQIIYLPNNIKIIFNNNNLIVENTDKKLIISIKFLYFLDYNLTKDSIEFFIKPEFYTYTASKMMLYTFTSDFVQKLKGILELYRGVINLKGLGYSVTVTKLSNQKYNLFFRFGFKDKANFIMPDNIIIENYETVKTQMVLYSHDLALLKKVQINIRRLRYPKAYKLQGIYLNDTFPKIKKFTK